MNIQEVSVFAKRNEWKVDHGKETSFLFCKDGDIVDYEPKGDDENETNQVCVYRNNDFVMDGPCEPLGVKIILMGLDADRKTGSGISSETIAEFNSIEVDDVLSRSLGGENKLYGVKRITQDHSGEAALDVYRIGSSPVFVTLVRLTDFSREGWEKTEMKVKKK